MLNLVVRKVTARLYKVKALRSFEQSVTVCQSTQRDTPDNLNLQQQRCESLISCNVRIHVYWSCYAKHIAETLCS
jgi:hypothetical protein